MKSECLIVMLFVLFGSSTPDADTGTCDDFVTIVSRAEWGARQPRHPTANITVPVNMTFIHHSDRPWRGTNLTECIKQVRSIQNFHMDFRGWDDIGYTHLVCEDGRVYEGRGWNVRGAHTLGYNEIAIGICIIGDYMNRLPLPAALNATQQLLACGVDKGFIKADYELFGHRDGRLNTTCPGDDLYAYIDGWPHYSTRHIHKYSSLQRRSSSSSRSSNSVAAENDFMHVLASLDGGDTHDSLVQQL